MQKSRKQDDFFLPHICTFSNTRNVYKGGEGGGKSQDNSSIDTGSCALHKVCTIHVICLQTVTLAPIKTMFSSSVLGRSKGPDVGSRMGNRNPLDRL